MSDRWVKATHPEHGTITGIVNPAATNGAGYNILMGDRSTAFVNVGQDRWVVEDVMGPIDPESPLGVVIAALYRDFPMGIANDDWANSPYIGGYVDLIMSVAMQQGVLDSERRDVAELRLETREIIQKNKPKSGEIVSD